MTTLREVLDLAKTQPISVEILVKAFPDVDEDKACRILKACWDRGLLLPAAKAWFGLPVEGSLPWSTDDQRRAGHSASIGKTWSSDRKVKYYRDELEKINKFYDELGMGITVNDVRAIFDCTHERARLFLRVLVEAGELIEQEATAGGAYGRRPKIYARDNQDYLRRNSVFIEEAPLKEERRKAKIKATKQAAKVTAATQTARKPKPVKHEAEVAVVSEREWHSPFEA